MPVLYDENGTPIKRKRGRPSNQERLEAELQASLRAKIQGNDAPKSAKQPQSIPKLANSNNASITTGIPRQDNTGDVKKKEKFGEEEI